MAEPMDIDKGKAFAGDGPSTSGKNFDLPWVSHSVASDLADSQLQSDIRRAYEKRLKGGISFSFCFGVMPQVEKYRPQLVKDIVGNVEAVGRLQVIAEEGNLPNVILAASPDAPQDPSAGVPKLPWQAEL